MRKLGAYFFFLGPGVRLEEDKARKGLFGCLCRELTMAWTLLVHRLF